MGDRNASQGLDLGFAQVVLELLAGWLPAATVSYAAVRHTRRGKGG